jgi:tRNA-specific 2-thiouridylase
VTAQIRYRHREAAASLTPIGADRVRVLFDEPQTAVAPGQAVVFYEGDVVVGGGWID